MQCAVSSRHIAMAFAAHIIASLLSGTVYSERDLNLKTVAGKHGIVDRFKNE